jgi:hypothetical protein
MARSYDELCTMAARFGFRLAKARRGSQHLGTPVLVDEAQRGPTSTNDPVFQFDELQKPYTRHPVIITDVRDIGSVERSRGFLVGHDREAVELGKCDYEGVSGIALLLFHH